MNYFIIFKLTFNRNLFWFSGVDFEIKNIELYGKEITLQIWLVAIR